MQATGLTGSEGPQDGDWERCHPEASSPLQVEAVYVSESDWYLPDPPEPECGTSRGKTPMVLVQRLPSSVVRRYINESNAHIFASTASGSAPASYDEQTIQTANGKKTLKRLQEEATQLKLPTKGTKAQLEKRLKIYRENDLNRSLVETAMTVLPLDATEFRDVPPYWALRDISVANITWLSAVAVFNYFQDRNAMNSYKNGRTLLKDCFLKHVSYGRVSENVLQFRGYCGATMKKQVLYKVQFEICCQNQRITKSRCECVAGAGNSSACKHCAALMCCVEDFVTTGTVTQDLGCTNTLQAWHRPPKHAPKRAINEPISSMLRKRQKTTETHYNRTKSTSATTDFVNRSVNSGLNLSIHIKRNANIHGLANDHFYLRKSLFQTTVEDINYVDEKKANQLEQNTMGQNSNKSWFEARRSRITASNIKGICTAIRTSCSQNKACSVTPARYNFEAKDLSKIPAIAWGKSREKEAFQLFQAQSLSSKTFRECGLFIDLSRHYLAASPDGICCCRAEIIEIKCPYKIRFQEPTKADYLNDSGHLIRSHQYYYQVQFQLHVTRAKKCHFVVYTTKGIHVTTIPYDMNFINSILPSLDKFYKEVFCEEYCKKFGFNC